jgi:hypothetical protein
MSQKVRGPMQLLSCAATVLFLGAVLSGCATVDQKIGLGYGPPLEQVPGRHTGAVVVSRVDDPAATRNKKGEWIIGSINNVHGVHRADLLSDQAVGEWISDALMLELKRAGYGVTQAASLPAGVPAALLVTGIRVVTNINKGVTSDDVSHELSFNVEVFVKGDRVKTLTVASRDSSTMLSASREEMEKMMRRALHDALQRVVPDIIAQIGDK